MNELKIFENEEFGSLRTMEIDGKIYFVAKDSQEFWGIPIQEKLLVTMWTKKIRG